MTTYTLDNLALTTSMSNIVSFGESGSSTRRYWFAYRLNRSSLCLASSKDLQSWEPLWLGEKGLGIEPVTDCRPQLVVVGDALYVFWMDRGKNALLATKYAPRLEEPFDYTWYPFVYCKNPGGVNIKGRGDAKAAAPFGAVASGGSILVSVNYDISINTLDLDPLTWGTAWKAGNEDRIDPSQWSALPNLKSFGADQAMTLFSLGDEGRRRGSAGHRCRPEQAFGGADGGRSGAGCL